MLNLFSFLALIRSRNKSWHGDSEMRGKRMKGEESCTRRLTPVLGLGLDFQGTLEECTETSPYSPLDSNGALLKKKKSTCFLRSGLRFPKQEMQNFLPGFIYEGKILPLSLLLCEICWFNFLFFLD